MGSRFFGVIALKPTPNQPSILTKHNFGFYADVVVGYAGVGVIGKTVLIGATPVVRRVVLFDKCNFQPVRVTVSAADGSYAFSGLNHQLKNRFMAIAVDHTMMYEPAVADNLTPEV